MLAAASAHVERRRDGDSGGFLDVFLTTSRLPGPMLRAFEHVRNEEGL